MSFRRPCCALLTASLLAFAAPARGGSLVRYEDFTTSGRLRSTAGLQLPAAVACGDETRHAIPLRPDEVVYAPVALGEDPQLVVGGCLVGPRGGARAAARLEVHFDPSGEEDGPGLAIGVPIPAPDVWRSRTVDWGALAGRGGTLRVRAVLPPGSRFWLRELHVRHLREVSAKTASPQAGPQVLLVSVDTLRADGIGALGGSARTPALDRLVAESQAFSRHHASATWTKPSHASLLTGQSALVHGATGFGSTIHPSLPTLAERFQAAGFATGGLVSYCVVLGAEFGFGRGFDRYRSVFWELPQMTRAAVDWMVRHRDRPFFYFLHTYEVHSDFGRLPYEGPGARQRNVRRRFGVANYGCERDDCATARLTRIGRGELAPLAGEAEILRFLYGAGVAQVDRALGDLFDDLRAMDLFDRMLIVVTSDHGEAFLEHANTLHGGHWNEVLRVPLLVKWPGGRHAGERLDINTSALDVAPTLLAAAGIDASDLPGRDLAAARGEVPVYADVPVPVVISGGHKAVFGPRGQTLLFDLAADPGERRNLAPERPGAVAELETLLRARLAREEAAARALEQQAPVPEPRALSEAEREHLRLLGYEHAP